VVDADHFPGSARSAESENRRQQYCQCDAVKGVEVIAHLGATNPDGMYFLSYQKAYFFLPDRVHPDVITLAV